LEDPAGHVLEPAERSTCCSAPRLESLTPMTPEANTMEYAMVIEPSSLSTTWKLLRGPDLWLYSFTFT